MSEPIMDEAAVPAAHTPGPWTHGDIRVMCDRTLNDPKDMHWPIFWPDNGCAAHVFRLEDARLIAAAPDLLAAAKMFLVWGGYASPSKNGVGLPSEKEVAAAMESAIAKATGKGAA